MKLKSKNPNLKILLAVGGWNMASQPFVPVVESAASRATFAQNAVTFLRQRNFEGLDMDWEYPGSRGGTPADRDKLVLLMQVQLQKSISYFNITCNEMTLEMISYLRI